MKPHFESPTALFVLFVANLVSAVARTPAVTLTQSPASLTFNYTNRQCAAGGTIGVRAVERRRDAR